MCVCACVYVCVRVRVCVYLSPCYKLVSFKVSLTIWIVWHHWCIYVLLVCRWTILEYNSSWKFHVHWSFACCKCLVNKYLLFYVSIVLVQVVLYLGPTSCLFEEMEIPMSNVIHTPQLVCTLVTVVCECNKWTFTSPFVASCFRKIIVHKEATV